MDENVPHILYFKRESFVKHSLGYLRDSKLQSGLEIFAADLDNVIESLFSDVSCQSSYALNE